MTTTTTTTPHHGHVPGQPFVLLPLYIYPLGNAWQPLFDIACSIPHVLFIAAINPCNGPGTDRLPDASYAAVLQRLSYGRRSLDAICRDIDVYHGWNHDLRLEGIFVDETPSDPKLLPYMSAIARYTRKKWQQTSDRSSLIVYNPGVVVDRAYFEDPNLVVIFEQSESHWRSPEIQKSITQVPLELRSKAVAIVHSLTESLGDAARLTTEIRLLGFGGLHLTEQVGGGFTKWPVMWATVAAEIGRK
ncbi:Spherulation-specific family 4 [Fusarium tricinctum]|uniref:Spherulation-specific family 4 n=1 Tax=Fusarium tricinctum TaxID=61284 RepID=A0A8K0RJK8_9HYPO|nr:Spherulation-specific family 4 [Fusarium tricinctum]